MHLFKDLPIRFKLFIIYAIVAVAVFSAGLTCYYYYVKINLEEQIRSELGRSNQNISHLLETAARVSIKNYLRAIAEKNLDIITRVYQDYQIGLISEDEAKTKAGEILLNQKIGETGYIYCIDSKGIVVVHPNPQVLEKNYSDLPFIRKQIQSKEGYLEYLWRNPDKASEHSKALHMTYFEPWDWIISVSSYKSEFSQLISIDDFKNQVLAMDINGMGYSFVMDTRGTILIHPRIQEDSRKNLDAREKAAIETMVREKSGLLAYQWKNPGDKVSRDKIMAYKLLPDFNWIIGSSVYTKEAFAPLQRLRSVFYTILAVTILVMALASLIVSRAISYPLIQMIKRFNSGMEGSLEMMPVSRGQKNEIGLLESSFNEFVRRLNTYQRNLLEENRIRKETETRLLLFEKVFENAKEGISITSKQGEIQAVNQAFTDITGYDPEEVIGKNPRVLKSNRHDRSFYQEMWESIIKKGYWSGEIWNRRKNGEAFPELLSISAIREEDGEIKNYVAVFHDISEMKTKEQEIEHLAYHDPLTGLPNRTLFKDRLEHAISRARRDNEMVQLILIDIDNFKLVNDSAGHAKGDELLKEAAKRMLAVTRASDTVARLGGDEFIVMVTTISDMMEIIVMVERMRAEFREPFVIEETLYHLTSSIGISVFPNDGDDSETLIRNADLAMHHSKTKGRNQFFMFEPEMAKRISQRISVEADMRRALENDEFQVYFQPQVDNQTLKLVGMEALTRWIKEDGSMVSPGQFIPVAEESGLIVPIGQRIFEKSVDQACRVREQVGIDLVLSVNVSARQFEEKGFESMVEALIRRTGLPADRLKIEITESLLMKNIDKAMVRLEKLSALGITTAIDDFGTGYSSLAYLKRMPISTLKIDKSFIDDVDIEPDAHALVEAIVLMANKLSMGIVAEGVETREQLEKLHALGRMDIQGYVFAKPMPTDETISWIKAWMAKA
jgi:diguanylate cyclase (GGDEF)-like protein/PAS domain S-box-containing protein